MGKTTEVRCIHKTQSVYPTMLRQVRHAPERLYVRGRLPEADRAAVAVIGARRCSSYGREMARWFAEELSQAGVQIISGMAAGIDGIAQRAALAAGGSSFGVLGCGTDICYPGENQDLYEALLEKGGILSEHPCGTMPIAGHFPSRNRIISGLSDIVLVIEAKQRSGTLITVDFALEQGKDVYVLPGRLTDACSVGCNRLLRQGAGIALTPADILEALAVTGRYRKPDGDSGAGRWQRADRDNGNSKGCHQRANEKNTAGCRNAEKDRVRNMEQAARVNMSLRETVVWEYLGDRPVTLQELYERIREAEPREDMGLPEITDILMNFLMRGWVLREWGNQYERNRNVEISRLRSPFSK